MNNNEIYNVRTGWEVLGCILQNPELIKTHPLTISDFVGVHHKMFFDAINYIAKIYPCFKSPADVIIGMLRDFARNTDNDVICDMLKTKTDKKIALVYADKLQDFIDKIDDCSEEIGSYANDIEKAIESLSKDIGDYYASVIDLINITIDLSESLEEDHD